MSRPDCCFRSRTASTASPASSVAFHSSGSCNVVDATYLGRLFIRSAKPCSSLTDGHTAAKLSYVTRPSSSASLAKSWSYCIFCSSSFQYGPVQPPTSSSLRSGSSISILPSTERYSAATTRLISHSFAFADCACGLRSERPRVPALSIPLSVAATRHADQEIRRGTKKSLASAPHRFRSGTNLSPQTRGECIVRAVAAFALGSVRAQAPAVRGCKAEDRAPTVNV